MAFYKVTFTHQNTDDSGKEIEESGEAYHYGDTREDVIRLVESNIKAGLAKEYRKTVKVNASKVDLESEQQTDEPGKE